MTPTFTDKLPSLFYLLFNFPFDYIQTPWDWTKSHRKHTQGITGSCSDRLLLGSAAWSLRIIHPVFHTVCISGSDGSDWDIFDINQSISTIFPFVALGQMKCAAFKSYAWSSTLLHFLYIFSGLNDQGLIYRILRSPSSNHLGIDRTACYAQSDWFSVKNLFLFA